MLFLLGLFVAGVALDVLCAWYISAVSGNHRWRATLLSGIITFVSYQVFTYIVIEPGSWGLAAYCAGNCVGTYASMRKPPTNCCPHTPSPAERSLPH